MIKYSVCLDAVFSGKNIIDAIKTARECDIYTVEFWGYDGRDINEMRDTLSALNMNVSTFCAKSQGLNDKKLHQQFIEGLLSSIEAANFFGVDRLITLVGNDTGERREQQHEAILEGLTLALPLLKENNVTIMLEPLNILVDHMGYYLHSSAEAFQLVEEMNSDYIKIIFDIYHQQITEGNLINNIVQNIDKIAHFHSAGNPGRNELTIGEINYPQIFKAISATDYKGYVGLEYFPIHDPAQSLLELPKKIK